MRATFLLLPIAFTTLASIPALAQEAPRVIFCTGSCVAVDQNGVRTPAPKGTTLREGQRLETGAGAYAQLKLGQDAALGVGERAQVRFDQRSVRDRDLVMLDQGRIRMLSGEAIGKAATRALELRTQDGTFALRGADIEARSSQGTAGAGSGLTVVKVNAGDARLLNPQGGIAISKDSVQGIAAGNVVTDKSISVADVALTLSRPGVAAATPTALLPEPIRNLNLPAPTLPLPGPIVRPDIFGPVIPLPGSPLAGPNPRMVPVPPLTRAERDLRGRSVIDPTTGNAAPLETALRNAVTVTKVPTFTSGVVTTVVQPPLLSGTTINLSPVVTTTVATSPIQTITPILTPGITTTLSSPLTLMPVGVR
jgi:hypothetical protein